MRSVPQNSPVYTLDAPEHRPDDPDWCCCDDCERANHIARVVKASCLPVWPKGRSVWDGPPYLSLTDKRRAFLARRDGWSCHYCGYELDPITATTDHVIPRSKGGPDLPENCVLACWGCNAAKGAK